MCQTQPLEAFYGRLVPKVKGTRKFSPIQVSHSVLKDESLSTKSLMAGLQCHVRWEDLSNLELTREIQTHWLQMKSGRYLSLWAIHLIMSIVFLYSYSYGSPLSESLPSWTSTRARSPGRGFWTPTTGRFDLYIVRKHKSDKLDNNTVSLQIPEKDHCGTEPDREGSDQVSLISKCITSWLSFLSLTWLMCCYRETQFDITVARWNSIWYCICILTNLSVQWDHGSPGPHDQPRRHEGAPGQDGRGV